eukprot:446453_1
MSLIVGCLISINGNSVYYLRPSKQYPSQLLPPIPTDNEPNDDMSILLQYIKEKEELDGDYYYEANLSFDNITQWYKDKWIMFCHQSTMLTISIICCVPSHMHYYDKATYDTFIESLKPITHQIHDDIHLTFDDYSDDYDPTDNDNINELPLYILRIRCKTILYHHLPTFRSSKYKYVESNMERTTNNRINTKLRDTDRQRKSVRRIVLFGMPGSGKTAIMRQLLAIHGVQGMGDEIQKQCIDMIRRKCITQMKYVIQMYNHNHDGMQEEDEKVGYDSVVEAMNYINASPNVAHFSKTLTSSIQTAWHALKKTKFWRTLQCEDDQIKHAAHLWDDIERIGSDTYEPTQEDITWIWKQNHGINEIEFEIKENRFYLIEAPKKCTPTEFDSRLRNLYLFEAQRVGTFTTQALVFVVDLTCYNQTVCHPWHDSEVNVMEESLELFDHICNSKYMRRAERILLLNKDDLFRETIKHHPLNQCGIETFAAFDEVPDTHRLFDDYYENCLTFIQDRFIERNTNPCTVVFCHVMNALDKDTVEKVFWDIQNILIRSNLRRGGLMAGGPSISMPSFPKVSLKKKKVKEVQRDMAMQIEFAPSAALDDVDRDVVELVDSVDIMDDRRREPDDEQDIIAVINAVDLRRVAEEHTPPVTLQEVTPSLEIKEEEDEIPKMEEEFKITGEKEDEKEPKEVHEVLQTHVQSKRVRLINVFALISKKIEEWKAARKLIDNVFADLENMFYLLSSLLLKIELQSLNKPNIEIQTDNDTDTNDLDPVVSHKKQSSFNIVFMNLLKILITPLVYLLVIIVAVFVILPSCFFLLIVRMNKVETDTVKLAKRAKQIFSETSCQRFMRVINQLLRSSFMFAFLVGYPIFIVYVVIPSVGRDNDGAIIGSISSYLFTILLLQLFGTYRSIKSFEERKKLKPNEKRYEPKEFVWNLGSLIAIAMVFFEVLQLTVFAYQTTTDGGQQQEETSDERASFTADDVGINSEKIIHFASITIKVCYLSLDFVENHVLEYYVLFSLIAVGGLLSFFIFRFIVELKTYGRLKWKEDNEEKAKEIYFHSFLGTIIYGHGRLKNVNKWNSKIVSLLADALFLGICQKIVLILSCDEEQRLRIDLSRECWVDEHKLYSTISLILLGYYIPICTMIAPMFAEDVAEEDIAEDVAPEKKKKCSICCCSKSDDNKIEDEEEEEEQAEPSFVSFTNTISFVSPFLSALTVTECFMLISSQFVSKGTEYGTIISQSIAMVMLLLFTLSWSFNNLYRYGLTQNEPAFPFGISMIRNFGFLCGFIGCILEILRFNRIIDIGLELFILFVFVIITAICAFIVFTKYHSFFNPLDDDTDANLIIKYYKKEKRIELVNMNK